MGIVYVGVGLMGSLGSFLVKWLTDDFGYRVALMVLAGLILLAWPLVIFVMKDKPSDIGQNPDGAADPPAENKIQSHTFGELLRSWPFWLLLIGSFCSIGSIGAINFHMKFVFLDAGFEKGSVVDGAWRTASVLILWSSIGGRLLIGGLADRFSKKWVMTATYFLVAGTIPILLIVRPSNEMYLYMFALLFGFGMGADYMLIPLDGRRTVRREHAGARDGRYPAREHDRPDLVPVLCLGAARSCRQLWNRHGCRPDASSYWRAVDRDPAEASTG